eukprot:gene2438-2147_t
MPQQPAAGYLHQVTAVPAQVRQACPMVAAVMPPQQGPQAGAWVHAQT